MNERDRLEKLRRFKELQQRKSIPPDDISLTEKLNNRFHTVQDAGAAYQAGEQGLPRTLYQQAGQLPGAVGDVAGEGFALAGSLVNKVTGGAAQNMAQGALSAAGQLPSIGGGTLADRLPGELAMVSQAYERLPAGTQRDIDATLNFVTLGMPVLSRGSKLAKTASDLGNAPAMKAMPIRTADDLKGAGSSLFQAAEAKGGVLSPQFTANYLRELQQIAPQGELAKLAAGDDAFTQLLNRVYDHRGRPITLQDAAEFDSVLGNLAYRTKDAFGNLDDQGHKILEGQQKFRAQIEDAIDQGDTSLLQGGPEGFKALKEARETWSKALRMQDVQRIVDTAGRTDTPAKSVQTGFRNLIKSNPKLRGYTPKEKDAIFRAASTGMVTDALRYAGSGLGPVMAGYGGYLATGTHEGVAAAALPAFAAQQTAKKVADARQLGRAYDVQRLISTPSALQSNPSIESAVGNFGREAALATAPVAAQSNGQEKLTLKQLLMLPPKEAMKYRRDKKSQK